MSVQRWFDALARNDQFLHRIDRLLEARLGFVLQFDLDDALDAARADDDRNADVKVIDAVLAGQMRRARQQALLVLEIAFGPRAAADRKSVVEGQMVADRVDSGGGRI